MCARRDSDPQPLGSPPALLCALGGTRTPNNRFEACYDIRFNTRASIAGREAKHSIQLSYGREC